MFKLLQFKKKPAIGNFNHPIDKVTGNFVCSTKKPMPFYAPVDTKWFHERVSLVETPETLLLRILEGNLIYKCDNCNTEWIIHEDVIIENSK